MAPNSPGAEIAFWTDGRYRFKGTFLGWQAQEASGAFDTPICLGADMTGWPGSRNFRSAGNWPKSWALARTSIAGTGEEGFGGDDGQALEAQLERPTNG